MSKGFACLSKAEFYRESIGQLRADDLNFEYGYEKFRVYKCKHCAYYHLTTKSSENY